MRRALVSGGTGFLGAHLSLALLEAGWEVAALASGRRPPRRLELLGIAGDVRLLRADLARPDEVEGALGALRPDVVFHLAARGVRAQADEDLEVARANVLGAVGLLRALSARGAPRVVWAGSGFEYAPQAEPIDERAPLAPPSFYGATKTAAWELARWWGRAQGLELVCVRPFSCFGELEHRARLVPYVITEALAGRAPELTSGEQVRDYLHVSDVVQAFVLAADAPAGAVYNVGSGEGTTIRELATRVAAAVAPDVPLRWGARPPARPEAQRLVADTTRLRALGWTPRLELPAAIERTVAWYRAHPEGELP